MEYIKKNKNNILILLDFDGTIMNTAKFNWECYNIILNKYNKNITFQEFLISINNSHLDIFLKNNLRLEDDEIKKIRRQKYDLMYTQIEKTKTLEFVPGMKEFIENINNNNMSHCVVTNTSIEIINIYRKHIPILNKLKNWITREDYKLPKPNSECYKLAIERYGKNKKTIGFEDSWVGYQALKGTVDEIYIINGEEQINYENFINEEVRLINKY
jgi:HAD superfamily hydrolase (TIGR01509 family)